MRENRLGQLLHQTQADLSRGVIAFCGSRGLPANYGGFETAVDEITARFVEAGIECEVFCRRSNGDPRLTSHNGRQLTYVNGSEIPRLDTFVASLQTGWKLWKNRQQYDHVFWFNNANLPGIMMTRLAGINMTVNTDGLEWRRAKWSWPFKAYYFLASLIVSWTCPGLVSDSRAIQAYYQRLFKRRTSFIPYGVPGKVSPNTDRQRKILAQYDLEPGKYYLQITRIEPDNMPLQIARAFFDSGLARRDFKLIVIGYKEATNYAERLIAYRDKGGIKIHQALYDRDALYALRENCYCYMHGNSVGGTNPALLEAMAVCPRVMAIEGEFSREVLGPTGLYFDPNDIETAFHDSLKLEDQSKVMRERINSHYQWEAVARAYMYLAAGLPAAYTPVVFTPIPENRISQLQAV